MSGESIVDKWLSVLDFSVVKKGANVFTGQFDTSFKNSWSSLFEAVKDNLIQCVTFFAL